MKFWVKDAEKFLGSKSMESGVSLDYMDFSLYIHSLKKCWNDFRRINQLRSLPVTTNIILKRIEWVVKNISTL